MNRRLKIAIALVVFAIGWVLLAPSLAVYLIVEKPLEHADAIMVLSGSAVYKERTQKASELYKQGVAPRIFITDDGERAGWSRAEKTNPSFVELEQRELVSNGVAPDSITVLPGQVSGTDQEAKALAEEVAARPVKSVLIVTSAYHTRRALRTFEKILGGKDVEIGIAYAPPGEQTPSPDLWWVKPRGWQMVAGEYVKSVLYWMFY
ncbi:MAG TPA: YdcF family protein [Pyrinomonadaceae bacterium]|nr:YdcF family protein [Pyrinomonadaceae bacterium]